MEQALAALAAFYGPIAAPPREPFAYFVWDVVSARTLDARRDRAWLAIRRIPALTPDAMFRAPKAELKAALEPLGDVDARLDALREGSGHFRRHRDLPDVAARSLAGLARALRDVPHLSAGAKATAPLLLAGRPVAALDESAARVLVRWLGLAAGSERRRRRTARAALAASVGRDTDALSRAVTLLVHHARHACLAQAPHCGVCPLRTGCAHAGRAAAVS
ncbi:MAG: hypothetical protein R2745_10015 [Vicinamibacterales bacterium]